MHIKGIRFVHFILILTVFLLLLSLFANYYLMSDRQIIKRFNDIYAKSEVWHHTTWLGVLSVQTPCDNWIMQEIIYEIKPDFIIETGTFLGGSSLYYASVLEHVNKNGKVLTVDIKDSRDKKVLESELCKERVEFIKGDSVSKEVIDIISERVKNHRVLVTLDSLHTKDHVLKELKVYSQFVSPGSYIVVQDTYWDLMPRSMKKELIARGWSVSTQGPLEAIKEFLRTNNKFEIDKSREKFLLTWYPSGYLKRMK